MKTFIVKDVCDDTVEHISQEQLLRLLNEDRNEDWIDYEESDDLEAVEQGLRLFTSFDLVGVIHG